MPPTIICISYKFNTPLLHKGKPLLEGCKISQIASLTRDTCTLIYAVGYFEEDDSGYELGFQSIQEYGQTFTGETLDAFKNATPTPGLTREQDLICAAYKVLAENKIASGQNWQGKVRVNNTTFLLEIPSV